MRKVLRIAAAALVLLLLAAGIYFGLRQDETPQQGGSSAALGMMLLEKENGLYVLAVTQGSPAERAGVLPGDYLLQLEGDILRGTLQLDGLIDAAKEPMELLIRRDGREISIQLPAK